MLFAKGERKKRLIALWATQILFVNRRLAAGRLEIDFKKPFDLLAKLPAEARREAQARRFPLQINFGGVFWKKSELILNKIPIDCRASRGRTKTERLGGAGFIFPSLALGVT